MLSIPAGDAINCATVLLFSRCLYTPSPVILKNSLYFGCNLANLKILFKTGEHYDFRFPPDNADRLKQLSSAHFLKKSGTLLKL